MKIIKKVLLVSIMFVSVLVLSGCTDKKPITAEEFRTRMEGKSFILTDVTDQFSNAGFVNKAYVAQNSNREYQIEFYEVSTEKDSIKLYNNNKNIFESSLGNVVSGKLVLNSKNVQKYRATSNGYSMFLTRKGNTMIYARVPVEYSKTVSNFIKDLGY